MQLIERELEKLDDRKLENRRIMLIGRMEHVRVMIKKLRQMGYMTSCVLDNDPIKRGNMVEGITIMQPEEVLAYYDEKIQIIIYSPKYWEEMLEQFAIYGYEENKNVIVLDRPSLDKNIEMVKRGYQIYQSLQQQYGKNVKVFLANCPLGDYYLLGLYLREYCTEKQIGNYVMVGTAKGIEKLSDLLGIETYKMLSVEESSCLIRAWMFLGKDVINLKPLTIWQGEFRFNPCLTRQMKNFDFMDTFKKMIYQLPEHVMPKYPCFENVQEREKELAKRYQMKKNKTVILSIFSYSIQSLSLKFWESLTNELKSRGYMVAVNVGEDREENKIKDTISLNANFQDMMLLMEYAGTVIGMRSGFFDITAKAKCKKIILYPQKQKNPVVWNRTDIKFCGLKNMGLCEDAIEIEVCKTDQQWEDNLMNEILNQMNALEEERKE